jgi:hypothetical protein
MVELGQSAGLAQVFLDVVGAGDAPGAGDLDRHGSVEIIVPRGVDAPEASLAEPPDNAVAADYRGITLVHTVSQISSRSCCTRDSAATAGLLEAAACQDSDAERTHWMAVCT